MDSSDLDPRHRVKDVRVTDTRLSVDLEDGRTISVPVEWYPRLANATPAQRANWTIIGAGWGIHWPELDEDVNTPALLEGRPSWEYLKMQAPAG